MHHNFVICLWEPHLRIHCQADVRAVAASQNALEGSPADLLVALAWQVRVMSDVTLAVAQILQRQNRLNQHGHQDDTILPEGSHQGHRPYDDAQSWGYASPMTTACHALCNYT